MASAAAAAVQPLDRTRARRKAAWRRRRLVLLLMSPWIVGFGVFFGYPLVMSVYLSFTHYDLLSSPKWIGTANYRYLFTQDPQVGDAVKNTLWIIVVMVPLQVIFAFGIGLMLARARRGGGSSGRSSPARRWHRRCGDPAFVYIQPRDRR
jgi:multiple sugar transport system permease protein